jgi:hypothetical protein
VNRATDKMKKAKIEKADIMYEMQTKEVNEIGEKYYKKLNREREFGGEKIRKLNKIKIKRHEIK